MNTNDIVSNLLRDDGVPCTRLGQVFDGKLGQVLGEFHEAVWEVAQ